MLERIVKGSEEFPEEKEGINIQTFPGKSRSFVKIGVQNGGFYRDLRLEKDSSTWYTDWGSPTEFLRGLI